MSTELFHKSNMCIKSWCYNIKMCKRETAFSRKKIMEEWKDFFSYKVSNSGKVINRFGREVKGYIAKDRGYQYKVVALRIEKVRTHLHLNSLVCRLFNDNYIEGARVYHINGNINDCSIENLKISKAYTQTATSYAIEKYKNEVVNCCKHTFKVMGYFEAESKGFDVDNALGNAFMLIWKYLPSYKQEHNFYAFCKKYCKIAFLIEYKNEIKRREYVNNNR